MIHLSAWNRLAAENAGIADWLRNRWVSQVALRDVPDEIWASVLTDIGWGAGQAEKLGSALARGYVHLLRNTLPAETLAQYGQMVRRDGHQSVSLAILSAQYWPQVLAVPDRRLKALFKQAHQRLAVKGVHLLTNPWDCLAELIRQGDRLAAIEFLKLVLRLFAHALTYNQARYWSWRLASVVGALASTGRVWQCRMMRQVCGCDLGLLDAFLDGLLRSEMGQMTEAGLCAYVAQGIARWRAHPGQGRHFFRLASRGSRERYQALKTDVALADHTRRLQRYVQARCQQSVSIAESDGLPSWGERCGVQPTGICCDGATIYLPSRIGFFKEAECNRRLLYLMAKLELGCIEFGTYWLHGIEDKLARTGEPDLAWNLFVIAEHARISRLTLSHYPGLARDHYRLFEGLLDTFESGRELAGPQLMLYGQMVAGILPDIGHRHEISLINSLAADWRSTFDPTADVGFSWAWAKKHLHKHAFSSEWQIPLQAPLGRHLRFDLFQRAFCSRLALARNIFKLAEGVELTLDRQAVQRQLIQHVGTVTAGDLSQILQQAISQADLGTFAGESVPDEKIARVVSLIERKGAVSIKPNAPEPHGPAFIYPEWDTHAQDYLVDHVGVAERTLEYVSNSFYERTLGQFNPHVRRVKRVFEMMRPQDLTLMRPWPEGDDFDYRAMLDAVLDRKAGQIPSDRLYVKRLKTHRDIVVLVLVDLSRSTAQLAGQGNDSRSVLEVEKQALVLLCEALQTVGDRFGIAGFSGHGRLGVDFVNVKPFASDLADAHRQRIGGLQPMRSTRMGAAVRHGAFLLSQVSAKTKLLLLLGDGFPNDVDYKRRYAVADTRRAVAELRAQNIHFRAITVNVPQDPNLDRLFGAHRHTLISDVRQLPQTLSAIYRFLTH